MWAPRKEMGLGMSWRPASGERRERGACFASPSVIFFRSTLFIIIYSLRSDNGLRRLIGSWAGWDALLCSTCSTVSGRPRAGNSCGGEGSDLSPPSEPRTTILPSRSNFFFLPFPGKRSDCGECRCSWFPGSSVAFVVTETQPPADPSSEVISIFIQTPARASPCRVSATYTCQASAPRPHLRMPWEDCRRDS